MMMGINEICTSFLGAKDRNNQIGILAELNEVDKEDILHILSENGAISGLPKPKHLSKPKQAVSRIDWDEALVNRLRELYDEGLTCPEIGERMGMTKNMVASKIHRLGWTRSEQITVTAEEPVAEEPKVETHREELVEPIAGIEAKEMAEVKPIAPMTLIEPKELSKKSVRFAVDLLQAVLGDALRYEADVEMDRLMADYKQGALMMDCNLEGLEFALSVRIKGGAQ